MIEAWLSSSEMTASCSSSSTSNTPPFASKQDEYRIVASVPRNGDSRLSSSRVLGLRAADEPHAAIPKPHSSSAALAAATTAGWSARPR